MHSHAKDNPRPAIARPQGIDGLKSIARQPYLLDGRRKANSTKHSWHPSMFALLEHEYAVEQPMQIA
jgi:hypothetical protein